MTILVTKGDFAGTGCKYFTTLEKLCHFLQMFLYLLISFCYWSTFSQKSLYVLCFRKLFSEFSHVPINKLGSSPLRYQNFKNLSTKEPQLLDLLND